MIYRGSIGLYAAARPWITRLGSLSALACVSGRSGHVFRNRRCEIGVLRFTSSHPATAAIALLQGLLYRDPLMQPHANVRDEVRNFESQWFMHRVCCRVCFDAV